MWSRSKWVKTKVSLEVFNMLEEYARRNNLSIYAATRKLIEDALKGSVDLLKLVEDETVLLLAVKYRLAKNPRFRNKLLEVLNEF